MRKLFIALGAIAAMTSVAQADEWHRGFNPYNGYGHREWHGNRGGSDWVAPAIGGMLIGGMLMNMQQNYQAQQYQQMYQPTCRKVYIGNVIVDGQEVEAYKTICR
jgi:hypothetical protein